MTIKKQTMHFFTVGATLALSLLAFTVLISEPIFAVGNKGCEVDTAILNCNNVNTGDAGVENTGLWSILLTVINILTAGVGIVALGGIIYGAIIYTTARGIPEQVTKARTIFTNVVIGIVAYAAMYSLLNFIVPGGVFNLL